VSLGETAAVRGDAQTLVACAYGVLDLFNGSEAELLAWSQGLQADSSADVLVPDWFLGGAAGALMRHLTEAGVLAKGGLIDAYRLAEFQQIIELLPHFRLEEVRRRPAPRAQVVFTVPPDVTLPVEAAHLQRSLATRVFEALVSATERTLLASPFWSDAGVDNLADGLMRSVELGLPITLAGAKEDDGRDDYEVMVRFAKRLRDLGGDVRALRYVPPKPSSIFHAKLVVGSLGYLGSANFTGAGLGQHVEAGLPLSEIDVERIWWLVDLLQKADLLREERI